MNDLKEKSEEETSSAGAEESNTNSWLFPETNWATSLISTAKEKTKTTLETMKKDIHEFSDTLQHGANSLASATVKQAQVIQNMIGPTPDPKVEDQQPEQNMDHSKEKVSEEKPPVSSKPSADETSADGSDSDKSKGAAGLFGMGGWMKQMVETVHKFATEDTTKEEEECTEEIRVGPGGRRTLLDQFTLLQMQNDPRTFLQPPQQNIDLYKDWLAEFKIAEYNGEINVLLGYNPRLREIYAELVPEQVDNNTFWNRYFFKVHLKELDKQIAAGGALKTNTDKTTVEGHSPAPSNGKDDWSMCSSGVTTETEELENDKEAGGSRDDAATPRPQKTDDDVDDWEECEGEETPETAKQVPAKTK